MIGLVLLLHPQKPFPLCVQDNRDANQNENDPRHGSDSDHHSTPYRRYDQLKLLTGRLVVVQWDCGHLKRIRFVLFQILKVWKCFVCWEIPDVLSVVGRVISQNVHSKILSAKRGRIPFRHIRAVIVTVYGKVAWSTQLREWINSLRITELFGVIKVSCCTNRFKLINCGIRV